MRMIEWKMVGKAGGVEWDWGWERCERIDEGTEDGISDIGKTEI